MLIQLLTSYHPEHLPRLLSVTQAALDAGIPAVQFCWGANGEREMFLMAERLRLMTQRAGAELVINNRVDVALAVDADALHLGQGDAPVSMIRHLIPENMRLGLTVSSAHQLAEAEDLDVDYYGVGPIRASRTHPAAPVGKETLANLAQKTRRPIVAIGGVREDCLSEIKAAGASGIAILGAVWRAENPDQAVKSLLKKWTTLASGCVGKCGETTDPKSSDCHCCAL